MTDDLTILTKVNENKINILFENIESESNMI